MYKHLESINTFSSVKMGSFLYKHRDDLFMAELLSHEARESSELSDLPCICNATILVVGVSTYLIVTVFMVFPRFLLDFLPTSFVPQTSD